MARRAALPFPTLCVAAGLPPPVAEHRFHPVRRWRFDFAWPEKRLAVEVEGGVFVQGRHARGAGIRADIEKYNAAVLMGWRVLRYLPEQLHAATADVREALA